VAATVGGSLEAEIVTDDNTVERKTFSGTSVVSGFSVYVFP
jgi:hypothetical protein